MISLSEKAEELLRQEVGRLYYGRVGGLSIFFEKLLQDYFKRKNMAKGKDA